MEKFNRTIQGYDPKEVNAYLDKVIAQVEAMIVASKNREKELTRLREINKQLQQENNNLKQSSSYYSQNTLEASKIESERIINSARKDADRIINEALLRAEKTNYETDMLRRNIKIFKRRLKGIVEAQLEVIEDIDNIDL